MWFKRLIIIVVLFFWVGLLYFFPTFCIFIIFIPLAVMIRFAKNPKVRNGCITLLVIFWIGIFHYESARHFYLQPLSQKPLPKVKFLFPPAGWIMFYHVGDTFGHREVYGIKNDVPQLLDPHDIFRTRTIGYDNIHRGILTSAADPANARQFCHYLQRRFPYFDTFVIKLTYYPEMTTEPYKQYEKIEYQCVE